MFFGIHTWRNRVAENFMDRGRFEYKNIFKGKHFTSKNILLKAGEGNPTLRMVFKIRIYVYRDTFPPLKFCKNMLVLTVRSQKGNNVFHYRNSIWSLIMNAILLLKSNPFLFEYKFVLTIHTFVVVHLTHLVMGCSRTL